MLAALLFAAFTTTARGQAPAGPCNAAGWCQEHPLPTGNALRGVVRHDGAWIAVGDRGVVVRSDGDGWQRVYTGSADDLSNPHSDGQALLATSGRDVVRWEGESWQTVATAPGGIYGLWGAGGRWFTVGEEGQIGRSEGETWSWTTESSRTLVGISGTAPDRVFAAASDGTVLAFDGQRWSTLGTVPPPEGEEAPEIEIEGVLAVSGGVWLFGADGQLHTFDGESWDTGAVGVPRALRTASTRGNLTAMSETVAVNHLGEVLQRRGRAWEPWFHLDDVRLEGIASAGGELVVVGTHGTIERVRASDRSHVPRPRRADLSAVACTADGVWAVGADGTALHRTATGWHRSGTGADRGLLDVVSDGEGVLAVDGSGSLWRASDGRWSEVPGPEESTELLWADATGRRLAVGTSGSSAVYDGQSWRSVTTDSDGFPDVIWGSGIDNVLVGGMSGLLLRFDGNGWGSLPAPTQGATRGIWTDRAGDLWIVSDGALYERRGGVWHRMHEPRMSLSALVGSADGETPIALDIAGNAFRFDGTRWTREPTGSDSLGDGCTTADGRTFVVGSGGTILAYHPDRAGSVPLDPARQARDAEQHKVDDTRSTLQAWYTAAGLWEETHGGTCPADLRALLPHLAAEPRTADAWGRDLSMECFLEPLATEALELVGLGFSFGSAGPDGQSGTTDDLTCCDALPAGRIGGSSP